MVNKKQTYTFWQKVKFYLLKRFVVKAVIPYIIAAGISYAAGNPAWIGLAPLWQGLEKKNIRQSKEQGG